MIRVLHVLASLDPGGVETWLLHVIRRMDTGDFHCGFAVHCTSTSFYESEIRTRQQSIHRLPSPANIFNYCLALYRLLRAKPRYDVIHCHLHYFNAIVVMIALLAGVRVRVSHSHNDLRALTRHAHFVRKLYVWLMRFLLVHVATHRLACSSTAAADLFGERWRSDSRCKLCLCTLDFTPFKSITQLDGNIHAVRGALGIPHGSLVVGHVGRFMPQKNHRFIIEIFHALTRVVPHSYLILVGDGPLRPTIESHVNRLGLSERVRFLGLRSDVASILGALDVFLFPSLWEGLGLAVVEAQAAGTPSITSEAIPDEAIVIPDRVRRLPLSLPPEDWAQNLAEGLSCQSRHDAYRKIAESSFATSEHSNILFDTWRASHWPGTTPERLVAL